MITPYDKSQNKQINMHAYAGEIRQAVGIWFAFAVVCSNEIYTRRSETITLLLFTLVNI